MSRVKTGALAAAALAGVAPLAHVVPAGAAVADGGSAAAVSRTAATIATKAPLTQRGVVATPVSAALRYACTLGDCSACYVP